MAEYHWQDDEDLAAHYVLWVADRTPGAKEPGGFAQSLIRAMFHADPENQTRLAVGFPKLMNAVRTYKNDENGYQELKRRAGLE